MKSSLYSMGFEITRIHTDGAEPDKKLPAWVPFKGQSNPDWKPQDTSVWPIQKLSWADLTLRKKRDSSEQRPIDFTVKYRIRPVVLYNDNKEPVNVTLPKTYEGKAVPLSYFDEGIETNEVDITANYSDFRVTFTNGILSTQWLSHVIKDSNGSLNLTTLKERMDTPSDELRAFLSGDVLPTFIQLLDRAAKDKGAKVLLALYELDDKELLQLLLKYKRNIRVILSNTSKNTKGEWDTENHPSREALQAAGVKVYNRIFNNNHIGHNKFAVLIGSDGKPKAVMTGSTNWTYRGLCGQSNNAIIVESNDIAGQFKTYWDNLVKDSKSFESPDPYTASTKNVQGAKLRDANAAACDQISLSDGSQVSLWFSPNTKENKRSKNSALPPDLKVVFELMKKAKKAIFFAAFLPSQTGIQSIIQKSVDLGRANKDLIVYGSISDVMAMPNYIPPPRGKDVEMSKKKVIQPYIFEEGRIKIIRAAALSMNKDDVIGNFEKELLKVGQAIIHDKILVVDPLSKNGFVVMGSHNLGYKASYENDENLLIIKNNPAVIQAYLVHVLDVWEHYRFRSVQEELAAKGKKTWNGFINKNNTWLEGYVSNGKGELSRYLAG